MVYRFNIRHLYFQSRITKLSDNIFLAYSVTGSCHKKRIWEIQEKSSEMVRYGWFISGCCQDVFCPHSACRSVGAKSKSRYPCNTKIKNFYLDLLSITTKTMLTPILFWCRSTISGHDRIVNSTIQFSKNQKYNKGKMPILSNSTLFSEKRRSCLTLLARKVPLWKKSVALLCKKNHGVSHRLPCDSIQSFCHVEKIPCCFPLMPISM